VRGIIEKLPPADSSDAEAREIRKKHLEIRESSLRFSPLMACAAGSRTKMPGFNPTYTQKHVEVAKLLLENGAFVEAKDIAGNSVLHLALTGLATKESVEIADILLADYKANLYTENRQGQLIIGGLIGNLPRPDVLERLLAWGFDPSKWSPGNMPGGMPRLHGLTAARFAQENRNANCVKVLEKRERLGKKKFKETVENNPTPIRDPTSREVDSVMPEPAVVGGGGAPCAQQ
jgi:ankyrin repeat protein